MLIAGRRITGIGLGTAQFAFKHGTADDAVATVHAALDAGVRLIDTALAYTRPGFESFPEAGGARALGSGTGRPPLVRAKGRPLARRPGFSPGRGPATIRAH